MSDLQEFDPTRVTTDICAKCGATGVPMVDATVNGVEGATLCVKCINHFMRYLAPTPKQEGEGE